MAVLTFGVFAQEPASKLGFVSLGAILQSTPAGVALLELQKTASAELKPLQLKLEAYNIQAQAGTLTEADRAQANLLQQDYSQKLREYQAKLDTAYADFSSLVDPVIAQTAKDQGFAIVMNSEVAASSGLVIYADSEATDLTQDVKTKL